MTAETRPVVCVDFNGVLDRYVGWQGPEHFDAPRPGARLFLEELAARGYSVVVFTTRYSDDVWEWLRAHQMDHLVGEVTDRKPPAHVFVDDRAVCFRGDFMSTLAEVDRFAAHWETAAVNQADSAEVSSVNVEQSRRYRPQLRRRSS
jgi:hypothetical protein